MLMCNSTMDSEDLVEVCLNLKNNLIDPTLMILISKAEPESICAFFCYLFMMFYKFRQCKAVVNKYVILKKNCVD